MINVKCDLSPPYWGSWREMHHHVSQKFLVSGVRMEVHVGFFSVCTEKQANTGNNYQTVRKGDFVYKQTLLFLFLAKTDAMAWNPHQQDLTFFTKSTTKSGLFSFIDGANKLSQRS